VAKQPINLNLRLLPRKTEGIMEGIKKESFDLRSPLIGEVSGVSESFVHSAASQNNRKATSQ
jgi:hypothetical protein